MSNAASAKSVSQYPCGARFFKCALQVNPFDYLKSHGKGSPFETEAAYNKAINANIPVLGDAELILGLAASGEADQGRARAPDAGSIDD